MRVSDRSISSASMQTVLTVPASFIHTLSSRRVRTDGPASRRAARRSAPRRPVAPPPSWRRLREGMKKASAADKGFYSFAPLFGRALGVVPCRSLCTAFKGRKAVYAVLRVWESPFMRKIAKNRTGDTKEHGCGYSGARGAGRTDGRMGEAATSHALPLSVPLPRQGRTAARRQPGGGESSPSCVRTMRTRRGWNQAAGKGRARRRPASMVRHRLSKLLSGIRYGFSGGF